jgi:phosphohistidine phosphatase SixA
MVGLVLAWAGTIALAPGPTEAAATAEDALWDLLRSGAHVILMRHTATDVAAGFDPPGFRLDDCASQRNLSPLGRDEARGIGAAFRARGIPVGLVRSSRWCRCLDTARLAFGRVEAWPALDSFGPAAARGEDQTGQVRRVAGQRPAGGNAILVTHEVNVTVLTGLRPQPGEMIILTPGGDGGFRVAGRLALSVRLTP